VTARYVKADDMARAVLCGAILAVVAVAPALAWTGSITPLPTLAPKRSLKQAQVRLALCEWWAGLLCPWM
jgi:hypothetical protein